MCKNPCDLTLTFFPERIILGTQPQVEAVSTPDTRHLLRYSLLLYPVHPVYPCKTFWFLVLIK
jgi:hypothetical protein